MLKNHKDELLKQIQQGQKSLISSNTNNVNNTNINNAQQNSKANGEIDPMQFLLTQSKVVFNDPQKKPDVNP